MSMKCSVFLEYCANYLQQPVVVFCALLSQAMQYFRLLFESSDSIGHLTPDHPQNSITSTRIPIIIPQACTFLVLTWVEDKEVGLTTSCQSRPNERESGGDECAATSATAPPGLLGLTDGGVCFLSAPSLREFFKGAGPAAVDESGGMAGAMECGTRQLFLSPRPRGEVNGRRKRRSQAGCSHTCAGTPEVLTAGILSAPVAHC
ncbi:hypothetical protein AOLI_G00141890 [Acnodon oligacanthus]